MAGPERDDPLPELPVRAVDADTWEAFARDPAYVAHRWSAEDAAVVRFRLGPSPLIVLGSFPARTVQGEESLPAGVPGGIDRLGQELAINGACALLPGTVIDGILLDASRPEPTPYVMVFDLPRYCGQSLANHAYAERLALLAQACDELREAGAWPNDWVQVDPVPAFSSTRYRLRYDHMVLRDLRAPMGATNAALVGVRQR